MWVYGERRHVSCLCVEKASVVRELSVAEEPRQHGERCRRKSLIDERLLPVERLDSRTAWQRGFTSLGVDNLGIQLAHGPQPAGLSSIARVQWLAENELAAGGVIAEIEPIRCAVSGLCQRPRDDASRPARGYAPNKKVKRRGVHPIKGPFIEVISLGPPPRSPAQVNAINQDGRFVLPDVGD